MKKRGFFLIILSFIVGCNRFNSKEKVKYKTKEVIELQEKAKKSVIDSIPFFVKKAQKIIENVPALPDTLRIENSFLKGYYFKQVEEIDSARYYFYNVINLIKKPNNRTRNRIYFQNAWEMEEMENNLTNAISIAQKFIEISDEEKYTNDLVYAYNYLERANLDLGNYKESLRYNTKALNTAKKSSNIYMYMIISNSKAYTYYYNLKKKKEAFELLDSLKTIDCGLDAKRQLYRTYGILNYEEGDFNKAIEFYETVLRLTKKISRQTKTNESKVDYNYNLLESYNNISEAHIKLKNYNTAAKYLDSTKSIINTNSYQPYVNTYYRLRFLLNYRTKANEEDVLSEYNALIALNKKKHQEKIEEKLYALTLANEKEKQVISEKNTIEVRNIKLIALLGFLILLMIIGYLFYRQRNYKFQKQEIKIHQRLLRAQMNSHFTFNMLSLIQNKIVTNQELAVNYLLKFSRLLRLILNNSLYNYVLLEDELELLRKYIDLQLFRFPDKFNYKIELENFEEDELLYIPPMLIQPFIENSIEHGFLGIDNGGEILIRLRLQRKYIYCEIEDNGAGLKDSSNTYKKSISTNLIFKFIHKITKQKVILLDKKSRETKESGVIVKFLIPYKLSEND